MARRPKGDERATNSEIERAALNALACAVSATGMRSQMGVVLEQGLLPLLASVAATRAAVAVG